MMKLSFNLLIIISGLAAMNAYAYTQAECIECHKMESRSSVLQISIEDFNGSVHGGGITCMDCHSGIEGAEHQNISGSGRVDCNQCHEQENDHGIKAKKKDRPQCHTCHGTHDILETNNTASAVHRDQLKFTCTKCHSMECGEIDSFSWLPLLRIKSHKKQDFSRDYQRTNCVGCHQGMAAHGEKESLDSQDCHKCHMDLRHYGSITGSFHLRSEMVNKLVSIAYVIFILVMLGFVFKYIGSDFIKKMKRNMD